MSHHDSQILERHHERCCFYRPVSANASIQLNLWSEKAQRRTDNDGRTHLAGSTSGIFRFIRLNGEVDAHFGSAWR
jgi:hypothetical protein